MLIFRAEREASRLDMAILAIAMRIGGVAQKCHNTQLQKKELDMFLKRARRGVLDVARQQVSLTKSNDQLHRQRLNGILALGGVVSNLNRQISSIEDVSKRAEYMLAAGNTEDAYIQLRIEGKEKSEFLEELYRKDMDLENAPSKGRYGYVFMYIYVFICICI
jgi:DNA integrity scanning protein DisA with diadenylate cyclase activity